MTPEHAKEQAALAAVTRYANAVRDEAAKRAAVICAFDAAPRLVWCQAAGDPITTGYADARKIAQNLAKNLPGEPVFILAALEWTKAEPVARPEVRPMAEWTGPIVAVVDEDDEDEDFDL